MKLRVLDPADVERLGWSPEGAERLDRELAALRDTPELSDAEMRQMTDRVYALVLQQAGRLA